LDIRRPLEGRLLCGPRIDDLSLAGTSRQVELHGSSFACFLLHSPLAKRSRVIVTAENRAELQVSLVRLPRPTARLALSWDKSSPSRLVLQCHDAEVTLDSVAWERFPPEANRPTDTSYRQKVPVSRTVREWFGDPHLRAGEARTSEIRDLPRPKDARETIIVKVAGTDVEGHRVAAWEVVAPGSSANKSGRP
jgi:hypothetical protein